MIKPLLTLALSCLFLTATAQEQPTDYKRSQFSISYGLANPAGDFGNDDWDEPNPPFAKNGSLLSLSYTKGLGKHFGLGATWARRSNDFNSSQYLKYRKDTNYSYTKASGDAWKSSFALGDVYLKAPLHSSGTVNLLLYAKASAGMAFHTSPSYNLETAFDRQTYDAMKDKTFAYGFGAGLEFTSGHFGLGFEANLLSASAEFERVTHSKDEYNQPKTYTRTIEQGLNTFNAAVKLSYIL
ncbi:hypothetical protein H8S95_15015 [Pontibacter sp. KCTC 32443]|uniref:outer membrane beta-barrel protein n=1 Tax=Pontibacter TaxID=323449 RepID=UPI00164D6C95|nr:MULTISPECIES: outer membrane beta-barrel protein [Pontibacter]MBC5775389.1 hypothetical protein [Pontibacter sp. KCTC 32443]